MQLLLAAQPRTQVLVVGVLPRGTGSGKGGRLGTNDMRWPSHYAKAIATTNALLKWVPFASWTWGQLDVWSSRRAPQRGGGRTPWAAARTSRQQHFSSLPPVLLPICSTPAGPTPTGPTA